MQEKHPIPFWEFQISPYILYRDSVTGTVSAQALYLFFITFIVSIKITCKKSAAKLLKFCGSLGTVAAIGFGSDCVLTSCSSYCMLLSRHLKHVKSSVK